MINMNIRLETKYLLIRPFEKEDKDALFYIMKDKEMNTYTQYTDNDKSGI